LVHWCVGRSFYKHKFVAIKADKFPAQIYRHGIEQLVGKMKANKRLEFIERSSPLHAIAKFAERLRLSILQRRKRLDDSVAQSGKEFRETFPRRVESVTREVAMVRALLDDDEIVDLAEAFPHLGKLRGEQLSEERTDADISNVIALAPDRRSPARIISVLAVIKRLFHEPDE